MGDNVNPNSINKQYTSVDTELEHQFLLLYVTRHGILGPNEFTGQNLDIDIFWYLYVPGVCMSNFRSIS